jgi:hypothetical protein
MAQDDDSRFVGVVELELALLEPEVRRDSRQVEELLDDDYREIGASGRLWTRQETLDALALEHDDGPTQVEELHALELAEGLVLLTYLSDRAGRKARRSSIWRRAGGRWRLVHHQGSELP